MCWSFGQRVNGSAGEVTGFVDQRFLHGLQSIEHDHRPVSNVKGEDVPVEFAKLGGETQFVLDKQTITSFELAKRWEYCFLIWIKWLLYSEVCN